VLYLTSFWRAENFINFFKRQIDCITLFLQRLHLFPNLLNRKIIIDQSLPIRYQIYYFFSRVINFSNSWFFQRLRCKFNLFNQFLVFLLFKCNFLLTVYRNLISLLNLFIYRLLNYITINLKFIGNFKSSKQAVCIWIILIYWNESCCLILYIIGFLTDYSKCENTACALFIIFRINLLVRGTYTWRQAMRRH